MEKEPIPIATPQTEAIQHISTNSKQATLKHSDPKYILSKIQELAPISVYALAKKIEVSYPTISRAIKSLEFVGLIKTRVEIGQNNKSVRIIFLENGK